MVEACPAYDGIVEDVMANGASDVLGEGCLKILNEVELG
jgi:hypothetical protein